MPTTLANRAYTEEGEVGHGVCRYVDSTYLQPCQGRPSPGNIVAEIDFYVMSFLIRV